MQEIAIKTHLIVTDVHDEYHIKWYGRIIDADPLIKNNKPVFIIISGVSRLELNTTDMKHLEESAKKITCPRGRSAVTTDKARIYLREKNGEDKLVGIVTHNHIKKYAPMYDKVGYR